MVIWEFFVMKNLNIYVVFIYSIFGWIFRMFVLVGRSLVLFLKYLFELVLLLFVKFLFGIEGNL